MLLQGEAQSFDDGAPCSFCSAPSPGKRYCGLSKFCEGLFFFFFLDSRHPVTGEPVITPAISVSLF